MPPGARHLWEPEAVSLPPRHTPSTPRSVPERHADAERRAASARRTGSPLLTARASNGPRPVSGPVSGVAADSPASPHGGTHRAATHHNPGRVSADPPMPLPTSHAARSRPDRRDLVDDLMHAFAARRHLGTILRLRPPARTRPVRDRRVVRIHVGRIDHRDLRRARGGEQAPNVRQRVPRRQPATRGSLVHRFR